MRLDIDKAKMYNVRFTHFLDDEDIIEQEVDGRGFFRMRNQLRDLGYLVSHVVEVNPTPDK